VAPLRPSTSDKERNGGACGGDAGKRWGDGGGAAAGPLVGCALSGSGLCVLGGAAAAAGAPTQISEFIYSNIMKEKCFNSPIS
jgi:hypothetical protein